MGTPSSNGSVLPFRIGSRCVLFKCLLSLCPVKSEFIYWCGSMTIKLINVYYRPQTKFAKIFTLVCQSLCSRWEGVSASGLERGVYTRADRPFRQTPPGQTPPSTMGYGQQAGGTHPTGMPSCDYLGLYANISSCSEVSQISNLG